MNAEITKRLAAIVQLETVIAKHATKIDEVRGTYAVLIDKQVGRRAELLLQKFHLKREQDEARRRAQSATNNENNTIE